MSTKPNQFGIHIKVKDFDGLFSFYKAYVLLDLFLEENILKFIYEFAINFISKLHPELG